MWQKVTDEQKIFLLPTDTIYGLHARAFDRESVEKINLIKKRPADKSFIVLISSIDDLKKFPVRVNDRLIEFLLKIWPGPYSVLIEKQACNELKHISSSCKIAFRMPNKKDLLDFIKHTGPLVSSSANISGKKHAKCFHDAYSLFKNDIDYFVDEECLDSNPSILVDLLRI